MGERARSAQRGQPPQGHVQSSCKGCRIEGFILKCSHCRGLNNERSEAEIEADACGGGSWIGNQGGLLGCEAMPEEGHAEL